MFKSIKTIFFSLLLIAFFTACDKETSLENGVDNSGGTESGTSEYSLDGEPLPCTAPLISGNYVVGIVLDISNTVVVNVNVTTIGTYTIATGLINGIRFEGSGTFTSTGPQTITLFGSGIPEAPITGTYIPGVQGCSFTITPLTAVITPTGPLFYSATIDGTPYSQAATAGIFSNEITVSGPPDDVYLTSGIVPILVPPPANSTVFTIKKGILHSYTSISNITFKTFFAVGSHAYGADPTDGIEILWTDEAGNDWSTNNGSALQAGSNFTITSVEDEPDPNHYSIRVKATYNCNLYDGAGNLKVLTGGQFTGIFSKL